VFPRRQCHKPWGIKWHEMLIVHPFVTMNFWYFNYAGRKIWLKFASKIYAHMIKMCEITQQIVITMLVSWVAEIELVLKSSVPRHNIFIDFSVSIFEIWIKNVRSLQGFLLFRVNICSKSCLNPILIVPWLWTHTVTLGKSGTKQKWFPHCVSLHRYDYIK
jgi:hypothetical protein